MAVMAAIAATLCYGLIGAVALVLAVLGVRLDTLLTFGGAFNRYAGMAAWWLVLFAAAFVYAALAFPWEQTLGFRRQRRK